MIARIEAEFAMSYLLGSALVTFLFYVLIFHTYAALVLDGGRKEAARLQGKAKSN